MTADVQHNSREGVVREIVRGAGGDWMYHRAGMRPARRRRKARRTPSATTVSPDVPAPFSPRRKAIVARAARRGEVAIRVPA